MDNNWFIKGISMTEQEAEKVKNDLLAKLHNKERPADEDFLYSLKMLWGREFFLNGHGYDSFRPYLYSVLNENNDDRKPLSLHCRSLLNKYDSTKEFYKYCWIISGGSNGNNGRTSRMRKNVLRCVTLSSYSPDDYGDALFSGMLEDPVSGKIFQETIENREKDKSLEPIKAAIELYQKNASVSADAAWYLSVNGNRVDIILGITQIVIPDNQETTNGIEISGGGKAISRPILNFGDSVFFTLKELTTFQGAGELKIRICNQRIEWDAVSFDMIMQQLAEGPVCFKNSSSSQNHWHSMFSCDQVYAKDKVWIVDSNSTNFDIATFPINGRSDLRCGCVDIELSQEKTPFNWHGKTLFQCQRLPSIEIIGASGEIYDSMHRWEIFTGKELVLKASTENQWRQGESVEMRKCDFEIQIKDENKISTFYVNSSAPKKLYRILYLPEAVKKVISAGEGTDFDGGWRYTPATGKHIKIMEHINGARHGTLAGPGNVEIQLSCRYEDGQPFFWLEREMESYWSMDEGECDLGPSKEFGSYQELSGYYLCAPRTFDKIELKLQKPNGEQCTLTLDMGSRNDYHAVHLGKLKVDGIIEDNADEYLFDNHVLFKVKRHPDKPQIFQQDDGWKIFVPKERKLEYSILFLSEKSFESLTDLCVVSCSEYPEDQTEALKIPDSIAALPHAVYACIGREEAFRNVKKNKTILNCKNFSFECIREHTNANELFSNKSIVEMVLGIFSDKANQFTDASNFIQEAKLNTTDCKDLWQTFAGISEELSIPFLMNYLFKHGFNFLMEPDWLQKAFEDAWKNSRNKNSRNRKRMIQIDTFSLPVPGNETFVTSAENKGFCEIFLDNQDAMNNGNLIHGNGWLPAACALHLLRKGKLGNPRKIDIRLFEGCGIREVTKICQFTNIWNYQLQPTIYANDPSYGFLKMDHFCVKTERQQQAFSIVMPNREKFLEGQAALYNDKLKYLSDCEDILYTKDDFNQASEILKNLLNKPENPIARHLLITFEWIRENVENLVKKGDEDLNHAVLGLTAIACRLYANANNSTLLSDDEKRVLLSCVERAFDQKYNDVAHGECWRFLMHYLIPVDMTIYFYNYNHDCSIKGEKR